MPGPVRSNPTQLVAPPSPAYVYVLVNYYAGKVLKTEESSVSEILIAYMIENGISLNGGIQLESSERWIKPRWSHRCRGS